MRSTIRSTHRSTVRPVIVAGSDRSSPWLDIGNGQWLDIGNGQRLGV